MTTNAHTLCKKDTIVVCVLVQEKYMKTKHRTLNRHR